MIASTRPISARPRALTLAAGAAAVAMLTACSDGGGGGGGATLPPPSPGTAVIATADFTAGIGRLSTVSLEPPYTVTTNVAEVSSDTGLTVAGGLVYVVNRFGADNVQIIDPAQGFLTVNQFTTENGSNPHDILVRGGEAFVSRFETPFDDVIVMDLADGSIDASIDVSPFADTASGAGVLPRADQLVEIDDRVFVLLQQIDGTFSTYGTGSVVEIDPASRAAVGATVLSTQSPSAADVLGDQILIASNGLFFPTTLSGGVEVLDAATGTAVLRVDDDAVQGNVSAVAAVSAAKAYMVVAKLDENGVPANVNDVVAFDPTTGAVLGTAYSCAGFLPEIGFNGGDILVIACQDATSPGVVLLDTDTDTVLAGPLDVGLAPNAIDFLD